MSFTPISIDSYVKIHLKNHPEQTEEKLRMLLKTSLENYQNGIKCSCGSDIWVIGSAFVGNQCFSCITGEKNPIDEYELDSAIKKREDKSGRRHIDDMDPTKICGFFDDDGYEINADLIKTPSLCLTCLNHDDPDQELFCVMTRYDQRDEQEFICLAYRK
jgi:hypothetical protein